MLIPTGPVGETPDISKIRRLDAENSKRREEVATGRKSVGQVIELSPESLAASQWISNAMKHLSNQDNCMFGVHSAICFA